MSKGFMYILECSDGSFYTGSTRDLEKRFRQHQNSLGAKMVDQRLYHVGESMTELMKPFTAKNRFRDGAMRKRRH